LEKLGCGDVTVTFPGCPLPATSYQETVLGSTDDPAQSMRSLDGALETMQVEALAVWRLLLGCQQRLHSQKAAAGLAVPMPHAVTAMENRPKPLNLKRQTNIFHASFSVGHAADVHSKHCKDEDGHRSQGALSLHCWQRRSTHQSVFWHVTVPEKFTL